ncbi:MAG TPA: Phenylacetic acid catabolic protein, partial [Egibacteraceae bacterium]|nr:Phenylacetic acid catabolic protein [Egibacteraceae bacterium]
MNARVELLLALADDALVLGHRHVQWTGVAPHLEADLAFTSIGLDAMGHALVWYRLAADAD